MVKEEIEARIPLLKAACEFGCITGQIEEADFIIARHAVICGFLIDEGAPFGDPDEAVGIFEGEIAAVVFVLLDVGVGVIDSKICGESCKRTEVKVGAPSGIGIGGDGDVKENGNGVAVKTVVDELAIEGRGEKVVARIEPSHFQDEIVVEKGLNKMELIESDCLRAKHLLDGELVADLISR